MDNLSIYIRKQLSIIHKEKFNSKTLIVLASKQIEVYKKNIYLNKEVAYYDILNEMNNLLHQLENFESVILSCMLSKEEINNNKSNFLSKNNLMKDIKSKYVDLEHRISYFRDLCESIIDTLGYHTDLLYEQYFDSDIKRRNLKSFSCFITSPKWKEEYGTKYISTIELYFNNKTIEEEKIRKIMDNKIEQRIKDIKYLYEFVYNNNFNDFDQEFVKTIKKLGFDRKDCNLNEMNCFTGYVKQWLVGKYRLKLITDNPDVLIYEKMLSLIKDHPMAFAMDGMGYNLNGKIYSALPKSTEEAKIYTDYLWNFHNEKLYNRRINGADDVSGILIKSFEELKYEFRSRLSISSLKNKMIGNEITKIKLIANKSPLDDNNEIIMFQIAFKHFYALKVNAEKLSFFLYWDDVLELSQRNDQIITFAYGPLAKPYSNYLVFLEDLELNPKSLEKEINALQYISNANVIFHRPSLSSLSKSYSDKLERRKNSIDLRILGKEIIEISDKIAKRLRNLIEPSILRRHFNIIHKVFVSKNMRLSESRFFNTVDGFDKNGIVSYFFEIAKTIDSKELEIKFLNELKSLWLELNSDNVYAIEKGLFKTEFEERLVKLQEVKPTSNIHTAISPNSPTTFSKIETKLSVEEIAMLFRVLDDAGYIITDNNKGYRKVIVKVFKSKGKGDFKFSTFKNKFNAPTAASISHLDGILTKLKKATDVLRNKL